MNILPNNPKELTSSQQYIIKGRIIRRWNKLLQSMFEIGYYDTAPKWYWLAVKETLEQSDEIANYIPDDAFFDCDEYNDIIWDYNKDADSVEMQRMEALEGYTTIECCWKLLDRLYYKIKNKNLRYVYCGLLNVFRRIYLEYESNYE